MDTVFSNSEVKATSRKIWMLLILSVITVGVYFNMILAAVLSKLLKTKVHWYEYRHQNGRPRHFNRWLEKKRRQAHE